MRHPYRLSCAGILALLLKPANSDSVVPVAPTSNTVLEPSPSPLDEPTQYTASTTPSPTTSGETPAVKRGKFVGYHLNEQDLYLAYKEIQSEYHQKAFGASSNHWRLLNKRDDVEVHLMEHPSDPGCPYVKMSAIFPTSVEDCWNFLKLEHWDQSMPKMDPFYESVSLHGEFSIYGVHMILARKRTQRILAFGKRDFVFLSVQDQPLRDGTWVSGSVSIETPRLPRQHGYTRAFQDSIAFYKPLDGNTKTRVTIICRIDLNDSVADGSGGWMPMWLYVKTIGTTGTRSIMNMRKALIAEKKEREEKEKLLCKNSNDRNVPTHVQKRTFGFFGATEMADSSASGRIRWPKTFMAVRNEQPLLTRNATGINATRWTFPWSRFLSTGK